MRPHLRPSSGPSGGAFVLGIASVAMTEPRMSPWRAAFAFAALGLVVLAGPVALAQPDEELSEEEQKKQEAGRYFQEGTELFEKERYLAAIKAFEKANELFPHHLNIYNIAKSYEKLGFADECIDWYQQYLKAYEDKKGEPPPDVNDIKNSIDKCRLGTMLEVTFESEPAGANIYLDKKREKLVGQTPFKQRMEPGTYTLFLDLAGHQPFEKTFVVKKGQPLSFSFKLERIQRTGTVRVTANIKNATVFVNGKNVGLTPYDQDIVLEEGSHQITVGKDEYESFQRELTVVTNEEYQIAAELWLRDSPSSWKAPVGWTAMGVGVALVAGGVVAGVFAEDEFAGTPDFDQLATLQKVGYYAGGGLAGIGLILLIAEALDTQHIKEADALSDVRFDGLDEEGAPKVTITPMVTTGPQGASIGADVRF